jgi:hypothetical protein
LHETLTRAEIDALWLIRKKYPNLTNRECITVLRTRQRETFECCGRYDGRHDGGCPSRSK